MAVVYLLYFLRRIGFSVIYPGHPAEQGLVVLLSVYTRPCGDDGSGGEAFGPHRPQAPIRGAGRGSHGGGRIAGRGPSDLPGPLDLGRVLGHGFGMYLSVDQALITQVLPRRPSGPGAWG